MNLVRLSGVTREFEGGVRALDRVDLVIEPGEYVAVTGPSGSGKSTLLNVLGLLDRPDAGSYELDGAETTTMKETTRTSLRGSRIGFVFQQFHLLDGRTSVENVELGMLYTVADGAERRRRARDALVAVGLGHRLHSLAATLSGGERQRVALARAVAKEPRLVLCDEPTGALDSHRAQEALGLLDDLHARGHTLVVVTHDAATAARAGRQVVIRDGQVQP